MSFLKRNIVAITGAVSALGLSLAGFAGATDTFSFIDLPETALADISQYVPTAFTSLWVLIAVVLGLPIAFWVVRKVIGLVHMR